MSSHRLITFTIGQTHYCYLDISDEEADKRFAEILANQNELEIEYQKKNGYEVQRSAIEFDDEFTIWGNMGREVNDIVQMMFGRMQDHIR